MVTTGKTIDVIPQVPKSSHCHLPSQLHIVGDEVGDEAFW